MRIGEISCDTCKFVLNLHGKYDCRIHASKDIFNPQPRACKEYKINVGALHSEPNKFNW